MLKQLLDRLLDLLFPPKCTFCHDLLEGEDIPLRVCSRCREKLVMMQDPLKGEFFDSGAYCFTYEGMVRKSIHRFKFNGRKEYAAVYARYLLQRLEGETDLQQADLITWVPTNRKNERKRGYSHAALLARHVAEGMGIPCVETMEKTRETRGMYGLKPHERRANILGAVKVSCEREQLAGKKVLMIDDIFTTGATAGECARVLRMAGAEKVFVLTVAKTEKSY